MTEADALTLAWTHCAPNRAHGAFPRGFWPDVARVALAMFAQQSGNPTLDFQPTKCVRGDYPEKVVNRTGIDLSKMEIKL